MNKSSRCYFRRTFSHASDLNFIAVVLALGCLIRTSWIIFSPSRFAGEAQNIAMAIARGRGYADAYFSGSGPTAHIMPTTALFAGAIYRSFPGNQTISEIILQTVAFAEIFGAYTFLYLTFRRLNVSVVGLRASLSVLCLVPIFMGPETLDYRYWEGALGCLLMSIVLWTVTSKEGFTDTALELLGMTVAATCFVSQPAGLACIFIVAIKTIRTVAWRKWLHIVIPFSLVVVGTFLPWEVRNDVTFGKAIWLRSNLGLELALAQNERSFEDPTKAAFDENLSEIHPMKSVAAQNRYRTLGETAYYDDLKKRTISWIMANPVKFATLCARHLRQMLLPSAWEFEIGSGFASTPRALIYSLIAVAGLMGGFTALINGHKSFLYPMSLAMVIVACYLPFQPVARYIYLNYGVLVFLIGGLATSVETSRRVKYASRY